MTARALAGALILAALAALFAFKAAAKMPDFEVYWRAGTRAAGGEALYRTEDEHYQLKYLPAFAVLFIPVAGLPLSMGKAIWFGLSAGLIPILLVLSLGLLPERRRPAWLLTSITFLLMLKFYGHELVLGQVNLLFAAIVAGAAMMLIRNQKASAGLLVALAVVIKPYAVIFLPWLAAQREVKALGAAAAAIAAALALPVIVYGAGGTVALHVAWWQTVTGSTAPNLLNADNVSLAAMFAKWLGVGRTAALLATVSAAALLAVAGAAFLVRRRVPRPVALEAGLLLTLIPLLSPQGWDYVFLIATPAVMCFVNYDRDLPRPARLLVWLALGVAAFTVYDVVGRAAYARFMAWSVVSVCFVVLLAALGILRFRRVA